MPNSEPIHQFVATGYITQLPDQSKQFQMHIDTLKHLGASDESKSDINKEHTIKINSDKVQQLYKLGDYIENQNMSMTPEQNKELYLFQKGIQFANLLMNQWYIGKRITLIIIGLKDGLPQKDDMIHDLHRIDILYNSYPIVEINQSDNNSRENTIDLCQQYFIDIREIPQSEQPNLTTAKYMYERLEKEQKKQQKTGKKKKRKQIWNSVKTVPKKIHTYIEATHRFWKLLFVVVGFILTYFLKDIVKYIKELL